jgi:hypothetical protein
LERGAAAPLCECHPARIKVLSLAVAFLYVLRRSLALRLTDPGNRFSELHFLKDAWTV